VKARIARVVRSRLVDYGERQRAREARRQLYLTSAAGELPVYMPRRVLACEATFETPRTHAAHTEIQEAR